MHHALPCIVCGKDLINVGGDVDNRPYGGTEFTTIGHYGSTVIDSIMHEQEGGVLEFVLNVCDVCIVKALDAEMIQSQLVTNEKRTVWKLTPHKLTEEEKEWVFKQDAKQYGTGEDDG
jgi:hypothetical protein